MHASALSERSIKANLTRCRKCLPKFQSRLSSLNDELRQIECNGLPVPLWILDRIRDCDTKVWFYQTRITQYEDELVRLDEKK